MAHEQRNKRNRELHFFSDLGLARERAPPQDTRRTLHQLRRCPPLRLPLVPRLVANQEKNFNARWHKGNSGVVKQAAVLRTTGKRLIQRRSSRRLFVFARQREQTLSSFSAKTGVLRKQNPVFCLARAAIGRL